MILIKLAKISLWVILATVIFGGLFLLLRWPLAAEAGPSSIPPRQTPTPMSPPDTDNDNDGPDKPIGAYIELQVQPRQSGLWSIIQWQDSTGAWRDVEGWQGTLDETGGRRWWVAAKDFGKGPFRWTVYRRQGDDLLATSQPFNLPQGANEVMQMELSLGE